MDTYLTKLEAEIAEVEGEIAHLEGALRGIPLSFKRERKPVQAKLAEQRARHECLLTQIQAATVGAAKPGQVL